MPRSVQTLPRPGRFKAPSHPLPKREGSLSFALDLPIFRGEPVAEAAGLQPTPRRVAPQTAPPGPGSFGTGADGQPGAMAWPLRTNYARQAGNGPNDGIDKCATSNTASYPLGGWRWRSWRESNTSFEKRKDSFSRPVCVGWLPFYLYRGSPMA
jgi:hypothetical protein